MPYLIQSGFAAETADPTIAQTVGTAATTVLQIYYQEQLARERREQDRRDRAAAAAAAAAPPLPFLPHVTAPSAFPAWALPVALGGVALVFLIGRRRGRGPEARS